MIELTYANPIIKPLCICPDCDKLRHKQMLDINETLDRIKNYMDISSSEGIALTAEKRIIHDEDSVINMNNYSLTKTEKKEGYFYLKGNQYLCLDSKPMQVRYSKSSLFELPFNLFIETAKGAKCKTLTIQFDEQDMKIYDSVMMDKMFALLLYLTRGTLKVPIDRASRIEKELKLLASLKKEAKAAIVPASFVKKIHRVYVPVLCTKDYKIYGTKRSFVQPSDLMLRCMELL